MIRMNCSPPRPMAARNAARFPAANARTLNSVEVEHRVRDLRLDEAERDQQEHAACERREHERRGPAHRVPSVRLDAVGDPDHHQDQACRERRVSPPVDPCRFANTEIAQRVIRPDGRDDTDRHGDREHQPPLQRCEHAAEHEPDEGAGDGRDAVHPERQPALVLGERVGQDRARVREQHCAADPLADPHDDQPDRAVAAVQPGDREQDREGGEDGEAEVEHPHTAEHVSKATEAHEQNGHRDEEAEDQPQQIAAVARRERIDSDSAKDVRQRDQQDRGVDHREQHAERRVRQRHPLVVQPLHALRASVLMFT